MKRGLILMLMSIVAMSLAAQNLRDNHFTVDASYNWAVGYDDIYKPLEFKGATLTGGYRFYPYKGLYLSSEVSLYYEDHELSSLDISLPPGEDVPESHWDHEYHFEVGFGLAEMVGYNINLPRNVSIDLFTGPYFNCSIKQKLYQHGIRKSEFNKTSWRWRFGGAVNVWRISLKCWYDLALTDLYDNSYFISYKEANVMNVGIGYHF